jgi:hypothetical protein
MGKDVEGGKERRRRRHRITGLTVSAGLALLPVVVPRLSRLARPAAKAGLVAGLTLYERGRSTWVEATEVAGDILAVTRTEADTLEATADAAGTVVDPVTGAAPDSPRRGKRLRKEKGRIPLSG